MPDFSISILELLEPSEREAAFSRGDFKWREFAKGSILHLEAEHCHSWEIIASGVVAVERIDEGGNLLTISLLKAGEQVAGNIVFSKRPFYPMTISARISGFLLEMKREPLFRLMSQSPLFLRTFLEMISQNSFYLGDTIRHNVKITIRENLLRYFRLEARKGDGKTIRLTISKKELAERMGVRRTSVSRELAKMEQDGLLRCYGKKIILCNQAKEGEAWLSSM